MTRLKCQVGVTIFWKGGHMPVIWWFISSWARAFGSPPVQKTVLGKTSSAETVCVKSLPGGGVFRVDCASNGVERQARDHWGRRLGRAWRSLVTLMI